MEEKYIVELIQRINTEETFTDSSTTTSWKALREAEALSSPSFYPILEKLILLHLKPKDKKFRKAAYFVFGKLLKNVPQVGAVNFYLEQLGAENDKYILSDMLDRIADIEIPADISVTPIVTLAMNEKWLIRHSAICALGSSSTLESKQTLAYYIKQEDVKSFKYEIVYANAALGRIGSLEDIPLLEQHAKSRIHDVRDSALFAIKRIQMRLSLGERPCVTSRLM